MLQMDRFDEIVKVQVWSSANEHKNTFYQKKWLLVLPEKHKCLFGGGTICRYLKSQATIQYQLQTPVNMQ